MKNFIWPSILSLAFVSVGAVASDSKKYECRTSSTEQTITITTNSNAYGQATDDHFTISSPGLFPEFDGFNFDLAVCAYRGMYSGEKLATGMHCEGMSLGAGYDYKTSFTIQSATDIGGNPESFRALIVDGSKKYDLKCESAR